MEMGIINSETARANVAKPGMVNLIPMNMNGGRVDMSRRNINIS
jgi:hypothetical protein